MSVTSRRHLRTFFLSFHHFNEEQARGVIVDAMRSAEGLWLVYTPCCFDFEKRNLIMGL